MLGILRAEVSTMMPDTSYITAVHHELLLILMCKGSTVMLGAPWIGIELTSVTKIRMMTHGSLGWYQYPRDQSWYLLIDSIFIIAPITSIMDIFICFYPPCPSLYFDGKQTLKLHLRINQRLNMFYNCSKQSYKYCHQNQSLSIECINGPLLWSIDSSCKWHLWGTLYCPYDREDPYCNDCNDCNDCNAPLQPSPKAPLTAPIYVSCISSSYSLAFFWCHT